MQMTTIQCQGVLYSFGDTMLNAVFTVAYHDGRVAISAALGPCSVIADGYTDKDHDFWLDVLKDFSSDFYPEDNYYKPGMLDIHSELAMKELAIKLTDLGLSVGLAGSI